MTFKTFNQLGSDLRALVMKMESTLRDDWTEKAELLLGEEGIDSVEELRQHTARLATKIQLEATSEIIRNASQWAGSSAEVNNLEEALRRKVATWAFQSAHSLLLQAACEREQAMVKAEAAEAAAIAAERGEVAK